MGAVRRAVQSNASDLKKRARGGAVRRAVQSNARVRVRVRVRVNASDLKKGAQFKCSSVQ